MSMSVRQALERWVELVGEFPAGTVSLVGAGPGESTLISVRGAVRLTQADVVLHDKLVGPELLDLPRADAERIFVGKWRGQHIWSQEEINEALVSYARRGQRVVRLKGGDPFVFGRGGEECQYLAEAGIPFEVVPGITAAFGVPALSGIPLTHRGLSRSVTLVTGHGDPADPPALDFAALSRLDTLIFYMGVKNLAANCARLIEAGMPAHTPAAIIEQGSMPCHRTIVGTVGDIAVRAAQEELRAPAMVVIGHVVRLRESIAWFERRPLFGQTVVVTRMRDQAAALSGPLRTLGAQVIEAPTIAIAEVEDYWAVDQALNRLSEYSWLVLTSGNGVEATFARLSELGRDARALAGVRVAVVGAATAERLAGFGIRADLVPGEAVGEALAEALVREGVGGKRVLLLRGDLARDALVRRLTEAGALCDDLAIYRTVCPDSLPPVFIESLREGRIDWITLTSPSSLRNLLELLEGEDLDRLRTVKFASIGPVTSQAILEEGFEPAVEADPHDIPGLVAAIVAGVRAGGQRK